MLAIIRPFEAEVVIAQHLASGLADDPGRKAGFVIEVSAGLAVIVGHVGADNDESTGPTDPADLHGGVHIPVSSDVLDS